MVYNSALCDSPLPQVAVKTFRFNFALDGDTTRRNRSHKVTHLIHNQQISFTNLPHRCSVGSSEFGGDSTIRISFRS